MCKLCNSDSPPISKSKQPINYVVQDYIGTFPCRICYKTLAKMLKDNATKSMDYIVLTKLYYKYRAFNATELGIKAHAHCQLKSIMGILPVRNRSTNTIVYKAYARNIKLKISDYIGTFPSLSEAISAKIVFLQNSGRTHGLTQLTNKLKELTCQN